MIKTSVGSFRISDSDDIYSPIGLFDNFVAEKWEADTALFVRNYCDKKTIFLDIGASNGVFTLYASLIAKQVYAFEPLTSIYNIAKRNIDLNPKLKQRIKLYPVVVSNETKHILENEPIKSTILSSITFSSASEFRYPLQIMSLIDVIKDINLPKKSKLVIKMDIEGAEFKILQDPKVIESLIHHKAILLVALHPGFSYPVKNSKLKIVRNYRKFIFLSRIIIDLIKIIKIVPAQVSILRTNQTRVNNHRSMCPLVLGGYYEYIFDFST